MKRARKFELSYLADVSVYCVSSQGVYLIRVERERCPNQEVTFPIVRHFEAIDWLRGLGLTEQVASCLMNSGGKFSDLSLSSPEVLAHA